MAKAGQYKTFDGLKIPRNRDMVIAYCFRGSPLKYKDLCERIYRDWRSDPVRFSDFDSDFNVFSLPEPYYPLKDGERTLVVLNNNPGGALPFQHYSEICRKFTDKSTYADVAKWLMGKYVGEDSVIGGASKTRNERIIEVAEALGFNGVENVETFFMHSRAFNKTRFLKDLQEKSWVVKYKEALSSYLAEHPVAIVAAVGSGDSLTPESLAQSDWILYQAGIAGLNLDRANLIPITEKSGKVTSCLVQYKNKHLICMMGSNNIPRDAAKAACRDSNSGDTLLNS